MVNRDGRVSKTNVTLIESYCDLIDSLYKYLHSVAHKEASVADLRVRLSELLRAIEAAGSFCEEKVV